MTLKNRLAKLETQRRAHDDILFERLAWVIANPREATATIGAQALARINEILAIARMRRDAIK